jgi:hypothetical protein
MMSKSVVVYSSFNNYEMFEGEALKRVNFESRLIINIDDHSSPDQIEFGKRVCDENNIIYISNEGKGVQSAIQTAINYIKEKKIDYEWIFCLQQDCFPMGENFFSNFESNLLDYDIKEVSAFGFNNLDDGHSSIGSYDNYILGKKPRGWLGIFFLSDTKNNKYRMSLFHRLAVLVYSLLPSKNLNEKARLFTLARRWFAEKMFYDFNNISKKYNGIFSIELPAWTSLAININDWEEHIKVDSKFIFHLWFPDVAMQFLLNNRNIAVMSDLYVHNDQSIKIKYGMNKCSADAGKKSENRHVEDYGGHLDIFYDKWEFSYENSKSTLPLAINKYSGTLVEEYFNHDCRNGPLVSYKKIN